MSTFEIDESTLLRASASNGMASVLTVSAAAACDLLGLPVGSLTGDVQDQIAVAALEGLEKELRAKGMETSPKWGEIRAMLRDNNRLAAGAVRLPGTATINASAADAPADTETPKFSTWLTEHFRLDSMMGENLRGALDLFRLMHPNGTIE